MMMMTMRMTDKDVADGRKRKDGDIKKNNGGGRGDARITGCSGTVRNDIVANDWISHCEPRLSFVKQRPVSQSVSLFFAFKLVHTLTWLRSHCDHIFRLLFSFF